MKHNQYRKRSDVSRKGPQRLAHSMCEGRRRDHGLVDCSCPRVEIIRFEIFNLNVIYNLHEVRNFSLRSMRQTVFARLTRNVFACALRGCLGSCIWQRDKGFSHVARNQSKYSCALGRNSSELFWWSSQRGPQPFIHRVTAPRSPLPFLLFENSKAIADFDTKAVSKIDQKWRILTRRRSVNSIKSGGFWHESGQ